MTLFSKPITTAMGDIDTMTTVLNIPVKNMEPERLDSLREALNYFKNERAIKNSSH